MFPKRLKELENNIVQQNTIRSEEEADNKNQPDNKTPEMHGETSSLRPRPCRRRSSSSGAEKSMEETKSNPERVISSSSSSIYSTAEEDFPSDNDDTDDLQKTLLQGESSSSLEDGQEFLTPTNSWVTGSGAMKNEKNINKESLRKTKSADPRVADSLQNNQRNPPNINASGSKSNILLETIPGAEFNQLNPQSLVSDEDDVFKSMEHLQWDPSDGRTITVNELQKVFDSLKSDGLSSEECERLVDKLGMTQNRNDFQWALHQLGGCNALLFLYARVVEICGDDAVQSKGLSLALGQIKNHAKVTDVPSSCHYNVLRFLLNNDKSAFGFKTFIILVHHCLTPSGNKLLDYDLLDKCLLSSWRVLIRIRCTDAEAPTGRRCLFECLLTVILDLLLEKNVHRGINIGTLKSRNFATRLLSICCNMIFEAKSQTEEKESSPIPVPVASTSSAPPIMTSKNSPLSCIDALRISALVKSIFMEMMAPPDAYVAIAIVKYGMYALLPKECPPLLRKEDAYFLYHSKSSSSSATIAEEFSEEDGMTPTNSSPTSPTVSPHNNDHIESLEDVILLNEDVPEIIGKTVAQNQKVKIYNKGTFERSQYDAFRDTFQESLVEGLMSVLLNTLAILPDGAFFSVLRPHLSSHLFLAYCSHPNVTVKMLALKLISTYLSRVKNPCVTEFLKSKGFFLASLYIHEEPGTAPVVASVCQGFGPVSFPLALSLLTSNPVLTTVLQWVEEDETGTIPALMSMGLIPTILNIYKSATQALPRHLNAIISFVVRYSVLNAKEDPWKVLFCPALESAPAGCPLTGRFYQEALTILKNYSGKELKKSDYNTRLLWLLEHSTGSRFSSNFDKWLLALFTTHIMELEPGDETETEYWKFFVKKNKKRLTFLMGVFLCKVFIPHKTQFETKQAMLKYLFQNSPTLPTWLPKVLKCGGSVERCFTAFLRIFLCEASQKEFSQADGDGSGSGRTRSSSFQSLMAEGNRLSLQLTPGSRLTPRGREGSSHGQQEQQPTVPVSASAEDLIHVAEQRPISASPGDKVIREKFEALLIDAGILSPINHASTFSADFRKFKILLETPPIYGVSYQELRQCLALLEKARASLTPTMSSTHPSSPTQNETPATLATTRVKNGTSVNKGYSCNSRYFDSIFETTAKFAVEVVESVTRARTQVGVEIVKLMCTREEDITARRRWWAITEQLGHPKAPWHFPKFYPKFSALDQSEGPSRMRLRLHKEHLKIHQRFVHPKFRVSDGKPRFPLEYLFLQSDTDYDDLMTFPSIKTEIQYMRFCTRIIPGEEICGEIILTRDTLFFIPELNQISGEKFKNEEVPLASVVSTLRRRYTHENKAVEIFVGSRSFLFTFKNIKDREEFMSFILVKPSYSSQSRNSLFMDSHNLTTMTNRWSKGLLSNFDYLMYLNTAAGRTYCDLMQYPVFPFILAKYDTPTLDLSAPQSYRDLKRPMAIQDPAKESHFLATYNYLKRECDCTPFHYGSGYSNSGIVLHYLIRLPPYTQHFLKYQDGSFDIPDRSFHSLETTWRLAAKESNTDFKEAIPEFYYLPEFLVNLQHFDFGVRQNGKRVDHVDLPAWAKGDPRLFVLINRQALESNHVRKLLCDWIDLVFGYKQTGKPAVLAMNVFHPSTYEGFEIEGVGDELLQKARRAMVATYGQTPKQLFTTMHPRSMVMSGENCEMEVLDTVWGIKWGHFLGSPTCLELEMINTREYMDEMSLFETPTRILFWPKSTLIMGDKVVGSWSANEIQIKSKVVHLCIGDEITTCSTTENCIWIGHQSGKIKVLQLSLSLEKIIETFDLVGHYKPIKCIDLNSEFSTAITCSGENHALIWDMNRVGYINMIQRPCSIDSLHSSRSTGDIVLLSLSTNTVTLTTINGFEVGTVQPEEKVASVCLSSLDSGKNVNLIAVGCDYSNIKFYSTWDLKFVNQIKVVPLASLPIQSVRYSKDGRRLYCLSTNEEGSITAAIQLPDSPK